VLGAKRRGATAARRAAGATTPGSGDVEHTCVVISVVLGAALVAVLGTCAAATGVDVGNAVAHGAGAEAAGVAMAMAVRLCPRRRCSLPSRIRSAIRSMLVIPFVLIGTFAARFCASSLARPCASVTTGLPRGTLGLTGNSPLRRHASMTSASVVATSMAAYTALRNERRRCASVSWLCSSSKRW